MTTDDLKSILAKLKIAVTGRELGTFSDEFLNQEIELAIGEINRCRRFTPTEKKNL